jgi:hypothetical protein
MSNNSFQMMVNHTDSAREYYYIDSVAIKTAVQNNWHVISMKDDWKTIFPQEKNLKIKVGTEKQAKSRNIRITGISKSFNQIYA